MEILVDDFGAGSHFSSLNKRSIASIAKLASKNEKYGQLLFRLVNNFQPQTILELGSSLGFSCIYMASACKNAKLITIEGSHEIARIAQENIAESGLTNITLLNGKFEDELNNAINQLGKLDFVFFDGNHQKEATLFYFEECLKYHHQKSVFVFDDIHWSRGMQEAWEQIKAHPEVFVTIDLFFLGLVFFRKEQAKENFIIRY